jgi:hypothetical protein
VLVAGRSITQCFDPGAEGTYTVVAGIARSKSTLTVTVTSSRNSQRRGGRSECETRAPVPRPS